MNERLGKLSYTEKRVLLAMGTLIVEGFTITRLSKTTDIPRTTIHWRIRNWLKYIDADLYAKVDKALISRRKGINL